MKDECVNCKRETLYSKVTHIDFRLGYVEGAGQLCLDCYGVIYGLSPKLQGKEKLIKKIKENKGGWEHKVPAGISEMIIKKKMFGYK